MNNSCNIYLDFQIIDKCSKSDELLHKLINSNDLYFCSVSHIEELYRAMLGAKKSDPIRKNDNIKRAGGLKSTIEKLCEKGILNPNDRIYLKPESIDECYKRIEHYDTVNLVSENAHRLKQAHTDYPNFSSEYNQSEQKWIDIWNENIIVLG